MATKIFEGSSGEKKKSIRFGAGRLMTFKEAKTIPDYVLKRYLATLEVKRDRASLKMKREEVSLEMSLDSLNTSFGEYVNVTTAEDVRKELKKGIRKQMNAQREQAERAKAAEKAAHGHDHPSGDEDGKQAEASRLPTPVREGMRRRKKDAIARKLKKPRPKYSELKLDDNKKRQFNNTRSYDRLMESYGRGKNDEKLEAWLDVMYPRMDHMSATIIGMKKRLERFQSREAMLTNPKEGGLETLMKNYKVYSLYPETVKESHVKRRRGRRGSGSGSSSGSQGSQTFHRVTKLPPIKSESSTSVKDISSSIEGVSESDIHLEMEEGSNVSKNGSIGSGGSRRKKGRIGSGGSKNSNRNGKEEPIRLPPAPKKGILHLPPIQATPSSMNIQQDSDGVATKQSQPKRERKRVAIMTPIQSREASQVDLQAGGDSMDAKAAADRQEEEDTVADFNAFKERMRSSISRRRSSVVPRAAVISAREAEENKKKVEEIKQQIIAMRRGETKSEGDFEMEMARRKSLMVLMGDDYDEADMEWLVEVDDPAKLWKDVKSCRYLRGHDPTEMQMPDGNLQEFVFWKGDFARESSFERDQRERKEGGEEGAEAGYDSDVGAIHSVSEATRRPSLDQSNNN